MHDLVNLAELLKQYDDAERDLARLRHELATATATYARKRGLFAFSVDHLRARLNAFREMAA